jgi:hypothetical protein
MTKLTVFLELMQLMETAFIHKLKKKEPGLSGEEVADRVKDWYLDKPRLNFPNCVEGDVSRFSK